MSAQGGLCGIRLLEPIMFRGTIEEALALDCTS